MYGKTSAINVYNVKKTFEILRSEITFLMDLYKRIKLVYVEFSNTI